MFLFYLERIIVKFLLFLITIYQKTLSFDHGWLKMFRPFGQCKFRPTCSQYAYEAISKYGSVKGLILALKRLLRCQPWSKGGYDPLK